MASRSKCSRSIRNSKRNRCNGCNRCDRCETRGVGRRRSTRLRGAATTTDNLVPPIIAAVEAQATVGEIADTLRGVFGEYREVSLD